MNRWLLSLIPWPSRGALLHLKGNKKNNIRVFINKSIYGMGTLPDCIEQKATVKVFSRRRINGDVVTKRLHSNHLDVGDVGAAISADKEENQIFLIYKESHV
jgi:hypothetical protein